MFDDQTKSLLYTIRPIYTIHFFLVIVVHKVIPIHVIKLYMVQFMTLICWPMKQNVLFLLCPMAIVRTSI